MRLFYLSGFLQSIYHTTWGQRRDFGPNAGGILNSGVKSGQHRANACFVDTFDPENAVGINSLGVIELTVPRLIAFRNMTAFTGFFMKLING